MTLTPFADEATALQIGGLMVENRLDRVSLYGSLDLTRDRAGLARARALLALVQSVVAALEREGEALPEAVKVGTGTDNVKNPFA